MFVAWISTVYVCQIFSFFHFLLFLLFNTREPNTGIGKRPFFLFLPLHLPLPMSHVSACMQKGRTQTPQRGGNIILCLQNNISRIHYWKIREISFRSPHLEHSLQVVPEEEPECAVWSSVVVKHLRDSSGLASSSSHKVDWGAALGVLSYFSHVRLQRNKTCINIINLIIGMESSVIPGFGTSASRRSRPKKGKKIDED